ncbi:CIS tube protein [Cellulomonas sp. NPDC055163]
MTTTLVTASLTRLRENKASGKNGKASYEELTATKVDVQFNPTSLKISRTNNVDRGGTTTRTAKRQNPSVQDATLSFDLEFDTADTPDKDVRDLTYMVRRFTEPTKEDPAKPPPAVQFHWGTFMFRGIVTQLTEDLDYFSPKGVPLRAKLSITITEQNPDWESGKLGAGARAEQARPARPGGGGRSGAAGGPTTPSAPPGAGPGSAPTPNPVSTALATAGESVQQVLARANEDPAAWRSAMAGLTSPLTLPAGTQVQLAASAGLDVGGTAGLGAGSGFTASAGVGDLATVRGALGLRATASAHGGAGAGGVAGGASAEAAAGFVLAEEGGLGRALARVEAETTSAASASARASFAAPAASASFSASASARASTAGATAVAPTVDHRALTYGRGVPLQARVSAGDR